MIELISESRCTGCNICVRVCPVNVFDAVPQAAPTIARQADCQTCFMCEAWCPEDAMFVSPNAEASTGASEQSLVREELLGSYRNNIGWNRGFPEKRGVDHSYQLLSMPGAR